MAHGFSRWAWSQATFAIGGQTWTADIDALALRQGAGKFVRLDRTSVKFPPTDNNRIGTAFTALCGTLVRVEIERATGALRIAKAYSVLECGEALVPEVVLGQAQGGFAMGVGYALLESLPPYEDGPGNGQWNLGQYVIARGSDLPLHDLEVEMLPPLPNEAPKGIAEVVMIPVVPALLNAIFDATGRRFQSLPVTQTHAQGSALVTTLSLTINGRAHGPVDVRDDLTMNDFLREYLGHDRHQVRLRRRAVPELRGDRRQPRRDELHQPDLRRSGGELQRQGDPHGRRPRQERRAVRAAEGVHRALRVPVRLLHARLPEREPGSAGASGEDNRWRAPISRRPSRRRSTATCAAAPDTSNITRPCVT